MRIALAIGAAILVFAQLALTPVAAVVRPVEGGIETARLFIDPGPPARVRATECRTCPQDFLLDDNAEFFVNGEQIPAERLLQRQGQVGTLIYNLESGRAVRLRW